MAFRSSPLGLRRVRFLALSMTYSCSALYTADRLSTRSAALVGICLSKGTELSTSYISAAPSPGSHPSLVSPRTFSRHHPPAPRDSLVDRTSKTFDPLKHPRQSLDPPSRLSRSSITVFRPRVQTGTWVTLLSQDMGDTFWLAQFSRTETASGGHAVAPSVGAGGLSSLRGAKGRGIGLSFPVGR